MITREEIQSLGREIVGLGRKEVARLIELCDAHDRLADILDGAGKFLAIDFQAKRAGGTSNLAYEDKDARLEISLGCWTIVRIAGLALEFDRDAFAWTRASLASRTAESILQEVFEVASRTASAETWRRVVRTIMESYARGHQSGGHDRARLIRALLEI